MILAQKYFLTVWRTFFPAMWIELTLFLTFLAPVPGQLNQQLNTLAALQAAQAQGRVIDPRMQQGVRPVYPGMPANALNPALGKYK